MVRGGKHTGRWQGRRTEKMRTGEGNELPGKREKSRTIEIYRCSEGERASGWRKNGDAENATKWKLVMYISDSYREETN